MKDGERFRQNYFYVGKKEREAIESLAEEFYGTAKSYFSKAYEIVLEEYEQDIPKHLRWQMGNFLSNHLGVFVTASLYEGMKNQALSIPDENNRDWLSLFASEA